MITKELLLNNGFRVDPYLPLSIDFYKKEIPLKSNSNIKYRLTIWEESNTPGRDWCIQIDNEMCMSCGSLDLQTIEHFNTFMDLLDLDFKL